MLDVLLETEKQDLFFRNYYLKRPFSMPATAKQFRSLLTENSLWEILPRVPEKDVLVVRQGLLFPTLLPRTKDDLQRLHQAGFSVVLRQTEQFDNGLGALARSLTRELHGKTAVQVYRTPSGHHSFDWHYDAEEVFILQTQGMKQYFLRENTVYPKPLVETIPRDMEFEKESSPILEVVLIPGDWLYIPAGWWHVARALDDSLSISIGVLPLTAVELLDQLRDRIVQKVQCRTRLAPLSERAIQELREKILSHLEECGSSVFDEETVPLSLVHGRVERFGF